jgi:glycosyltransferase involved in cell wall biosynthesis
MEMTTGGAEWRIRNIRVSLVIPSRDNVPFLAKAIDTALETMQPDDEIIVVGNGSPDQVAKTRGHTEGVAAVAEFRGRTSVRFIESPVPSYTFATNCGLRKARGQYIVIGNDDVIFASRWLDEMIDALVRATTKISEIRWGFVGPYTNRGFPVQTLDAENWPEAHQPALREKIVERLARGNHPEIIPSGALSGFCLMITRECYEAVGELDESYPGGGFTDNDWQLRGQEAGFLGLLAPRAFVYHLGHVSMDRFTPGHRRGFENLQHHLRKWYRPKRQFLTACYRVQINTGEDLELFLMSLRHSKACGIDACVILDDRSQIDLLPPLEQAGLRLWVKGFLKNAKDTPFNEVRDRNALIALARTTRPDWIINLDHDEILDERVTRADFDRLMNPIDPEIKWYGFPIFTFWRGRTHVRLDGVWGVMTLSTLFKNDPCWGGIYQTTPEGTFHCRRVPTYIPTDILSPTTRLVVKHYGYCDYERAAAKRAYYAANDKDKLKHLIGSENYEHLTDETQLILLPYSFSTLTIAILAKNKSLDIARQLWAWGTFADEILVVDTGSTDNGPNFARLTGAEVVEYHCCPRSREPDHLICDLSAARNFAVDQASGDYVLFLDPDERLYIYSAVTLPKMLLQRAEGHMIEVDSFKEMPDGSKQPYRTLQPRLLRNDSRIRYWRSIHESSFTPSNGRVPGSGSASSPDPYPKIFRQPSVEQ